MGLKGLDKVKGGLGKILDAVRKSSIRNDVDNSEALSDLEIAGYIMWCQPKGSIKRKKVKEYDHLPSDEEWVRDVREYGVEGTYWLQEIKKVGVNKVFGDVLRKEYYGYVVKDEDEEEVYELDYPSEDVDSDDEFDEDELEEEEQTGRKKRGRYRIVSKRRVKLGRKKANDIKSFVEGLKEIKDELEELAEVGTFLARMGGKNVIEIPDGKSMEDYVLEMMDALRARYDKMRNIFGDSKVRSEDAEVPIDGKVPAWMVYAPKLLDSALDSVERRLEKLGLVSKEDSKVDVPEFPKLKE